MSSVDLQIRSREQLIDAITLARFHLQHPFARRLRRSLQLGTLACLAVMVWRESLPWGWLAVLLAHLAMRDYESTLASAVEALTPRGPVLRAGESINTTPLFDRSREVTFAPAISIPDFVVAAGERYHENLYPPDSQPVPVDRGEPIQLWLDRATLAGWAMEQVLVRRPLRLARWHDPPANPDAIYRAREPQTPVASVDEIQVPPHTAACLENFSRVLARMEEVRTQIADLLPAGVGLVTCSLEGGSVRFRWGVARDQKEPLEFLHAVSPRALMGSLATDLPSSSLARTIAAGWLIDARPAIDKSIP